MLLDSGPNQLVMQLEGAVHVCRMLLPEPCRVLDVGEQERDRATVARLAMSASQEDQVVTSQDDMSDQPPIKDLEHEHPIPDSWRPVFCDIVSAFVRHDYRLSSRVPMVLPVDEETATSIKNSIADYGDVTLTELPGATWDSSVAMWTGTSWETLVDLWTEEEGRSDLVLNVFVREVGSAIEFEIHLVYVP